jgi:hypothetical protein
MALSAFGAALAPGWAKPALAGCDTFLEKLRVEAADLQVEFSHALVVSRARSGANVFDIYTKADVDGTLTCRGDEFERFEAHVSEPASARAAAGFERLQSAALRAALGWDAGKSRSLPREMAADVKEFFAASKQRGDVYIAGKTEEHAPGGVSLGMIQTEIDRAFIIVAPEE